MAWIRSEILPHALGTERLDGGVAFELADAPGLAERLEDLIGLERTCCPGLDFRRAASGRPGRLRLEVHGIDPDAAVFRSLRVAGAGAEAPDPLRRR
jgi:hypothetical protein